MVEGLANVEGLAKHMIAYSTLWFRSSLLHI